jgi:hypothetical protein
MGLSLFCKWRGRDLLHLAPLWLPSNSLCLSHKLRLASLLDLLSVLWDPHSCTPFYLCICFKAGCHSKLPESCHS